MSGISISSPVHSNPQYTRSIPQPMKSQGVDFTLLGSDLVKFASGGNQKSISSRNIDVQRADYGPDIQRFKDNRQNLARIMDVSEERLINWDADGSAELTQEQIEDLKNRYDITNISRQDYYNLMADLTDWNVISAKDVLAQFLAPGPPGGFARYVTPAEALNEEFSRSAGWSGNMLENTRNLLKRLGDASSWLCSNSSLIEARSFYYLKDSLDSDIETYQKLGDIFQLLV